MAVKMVNESDLVSIADAIRAKTGGAATLLYPSEFISEIESISGVDNLDLRLDGSIEEVESDATTIKDYALAYLKYLKKVNLPKCVRIYESGCRGIGTGLPAGDVVELNLPALVKIEQNGFANARLGDVELPYAVTLNSSAFESSTIKSIIAQQAVSIASTAFSNCTSLEKADFGNASSIQPGIFSGLTNFETLILRGTTVIPLYGQTTYDGKFTTFYQTKIEAGTGYIYVDDSLVADYKAATNWSRYAAQIKGLSELPS